MGIAAVEVDNSQYVKAKPHLEEAMKIFSLIQLADVDDLKKHAQYLLDQCNKT